MASKTNNFKKKTSNKNLGAIIGSIFILVVVVISFVVAPALGELGQKQVADIELGSYGNEKITFSFLKETPFRRELAALSNNSSESMDYRVAQAAYNRAVTKSAAIDELKSDGYDISKEQLDTAVLRSGYFNVNGSFSPKVFKNTTEIRKQELRSDIKRELLVDSWMYHVILQQKRSGKYLEFLSSMSDKKRNFDYVSFNFSDYPKNLTTDFANANSQLFTELPLSRITVKEMETADEVIAKLSNNESTFEELASIYSTDSFKDKGGVMNTTYEYELESVFGIIDSSELLSATVNGAPIVVEKDNEIILLTLNKEIVTLDLSDLSIVEKYMLTYERGLLEDFFYNKINNISDNNLLELGEEVFETGLFSINYGAEQLLSTSIDRINQSSIFSRAANNENFFTTLFNLEADILSEPIVLGDSIAVFKLKEEVTDETLTDSYILSQFDRSLVGFKSMTAEALFLKSDKYTDNFFPGYLEILSMNQGI